MIYKKSLIYFALCSFVFISACQKSKDSTASVEKQAISHAQSRAADKKIPEREFMLKAIYATKNKLLNGNCKVGSFDSENDRLIVGDLNHDGKNDFIYSYATVLECDAQVPLYEYGVYEQISTGEFKLVSIFNAGMQNDLDRIEFNAIKNNIVIGEIPYSGEKVKYILKGNQLIQLEDLNKKIIIQLGKSVLAKDSPFAAELDRMNYISEVVECGGFFSDDFAEKTATIDHYNLRITEENIAVLGVYGLTAKDEIHVEGKIINSATTLNQLKQLFQSGYKIDESKNLTETIDAEGENATKLKYDLLLSLHKNDLDDIFLFYFKNKQLIAVQYFIPC